MKLDNDAIHTNIHSGNLFTLFLVFTTESLRKIFEKKKNFKFHGAGLQSFDKYSGTFMKSYFHEVH